MFMRQTTKDLLGSYKLYKAQNSKDKDQDSDGLNDRNSLTESSFEQDIDEEP
jgi:hypothetical protein